MDRLIEQVSKAIDRLTELRTALIFAAVTGKVQVHAAERRPAGTTNI